MFAQTFGHGTLRKYVIYFGTLFNNINVQRFDANHNVIQTFKVPLNYGPREKYLAHTEGNPDGERPIAIQLPRMSFEMTGLYYDPARKLSALNRISAPVIGVDGKTQYQDQPVPYNIDFTLSIMTKNIEDGTYIVEQILPYFNPVWTATLNINPDLGQKYDVPITLDNITTEDTYEGNFENRRAIIWTLTFTMKAYFFGPTLSATGEIIRNIDINFRAPGIGLSVDDATPENTLPVNYDIKPGLGGEGATVSYYEDTRLRTIEFTDVTGTYEPTDILRTTTGKIIYVASSNPPIITVRRVNGVIEEGDVFVNPVTGATGTVLTVGVEPGDSISNEDIPADSNYGFIVDITSET